MTFGKYLSQFLCDKNGDPSSKRLMSFMSFLFMLFAGTMNVLHKLTLDKELMQFFLITTLGLSGASTIENIGMKMKTGVETSKTQVVKEETTTTT